MSTHTFPPPPPMTPDKRTVLASLLAAYPVVRVLLDRTVAGVVYPAALDEAVQMIDIGLDLNHPIPDLCIDALGLSATLSFRGVPTWILVPWEAIFAAQPHGGPEAAVTWVDSVPKHLLLTGEAAPADAPRGAALVTLDSRRTPKDLHACKMRRMGVRAPAPAPDGGRAA